MFKRLGVSMNRQSNTILARIDGAEEYNRAYTKTPKAKKARALKMTEKKRKLLENEERDKKRGMTYGKDAMDIKDDGTGTNEVTPSTKKQKRKQTTPIEFRQCNACGQLGHVRTNSKKCPEHPKYKGQPMMRLKRGVYVPIDATGQPIFGTTPTTTNVTNNPTQPTPNTEETFIQQTLDRT